MKARSTFLRAVARSCSRTLTRSRAHSRTRTHTYWFAQSLANSLAHFPSLYQSGKKRISNLVCFVQIQVSPTPLFSTLHQIKSQRLTNRSCILGKIAAGNLKLYLPFLLKEIQANPKRQYLLLHSLKEVCKNVLICSGPRRCAFPYLYSDVVDSPPESLPTFHDVLHNVIFWS